MTYLGRPSAVAPIYLLLRDFSETKDPDVLAQAEQGVSSYANSPDGRVSAAVINARAVALDRGGKARRLADNIRTLTFGWDAETLYAVRITRDGGDDLAKILEIDFASGATRQLATIRYPHPDTGAEAPVKEAQFIDDGGLVRLYAVADGNLTLWVLGAPAAYRIDPANGDVTEIAREPILWSPDGTQRVTAHEDGNTTALRLRDRGNNVVASTGVTGLVSHIRWAPGNNEIVFTIGVTGANGGVRQDLYVWDLEDRNDPMPLTSSGAAFGAEWRGSCRTGGRDAADRQSHRGRAGRDGSAHAHSLGRRPPWRLGLDDVAAGLPVRPLCRRGEHARRGDAGDRLHPGADHHGAREMDRPIRAGPDLGRWPRHRSLYLPEAA